MSIWQFLQIGWDPEPSILVGCLDLLIGYWILTRASLGSVLRSTRFWLFLLGDVLLLLALISPLDTLGDFYLFSAHMLQHMVLLQIVPPLLILGLSEEVVLRIVRHPLLAGTERVLGNPWLAWPLATAVLWGWHLPALYDAALTNEGVHIVQHLCFLVTATIFWWPVLTPVRDRRIGLPLSIIYLLSASFSSSVLGILITFDSAQLYSNYVHPVDPLGMLQTIRTGWGVSAADDQQIGGLLMWIPGSIAYLVAIIGIFGHWHSQPDWFDDSLPLQEGALLHDAS